MLQAIRTRAGGIIVKVLFGLLILSFGFWGIYTRSPYFQDKSPDAVVATVGDHDIRADEVKRALDPALERLRAQLGGTLDVTQAKQFGVVDAILEQIIDRSLLDQEVSHLRLDLSDDVVRAAITQNSAFVGPDGRFNRQQFEAILTMNRMTEDGLIARLRQEIPRGDLLQALTAGVVVPPEVVDAVYRFRSETRVADIVALPLAKAADPGTPGNDDLNKFYEAHQDLFRAPEYRGFTVASLASADLEAGIQIPEDKLKAAYDEHKGEFEIPEQRQVQQILAPTEEKAKAAAEALASGKDWQEVATTIAGQDPQTIDLGLVKQTDLPKPLADVAFDLPLDKASDPIQDSLGWHILRVVKIEVPKTPSFAEAKAELTAAMVKEEAADRLDLLSRQVNDALAAGGTLADVAAKYGLKLTAIAATDLSDRDPEGKPVAMPVAANTVLKAAFDSGENETSRVFELDEGAIFVLHVDKVVAPSLKPLSDVKAQAIAAWQAERKQESVKTEAEALAAAVTPDTPLAKVAADKGLTVTTSPPLPRRPDPRAAAPAVLVVKLFTAKVGEIVTVTDASGAYIGQLKEIKIPDAPPQGVTASVTTELGNSIRYDLVDELTAALKKRFPVEIHRDVLDRMF